jgi:Ion channel/Pentapeptide repeats (9 copies)
MLANFFELNRVAQIKQIADLAAMAAHFHNAGSLENAELMKGLHQRAPKRLFHSKLFRNVRFSHSRFEKITFTKCTFIDCLFIGAEFHDCEFHQCRFENCNTYKFKLDHVYLDPRSFKLDAAYRKSAANVGLDLYQTLFQNAQDASQTAHASYGDIARRRWRRYQLQRDQREGHSVRWTIFANAVADWTSAYGYGPARFFLLSVVVFILLATIAQSFWIQMGVKQNGSEVVVSSFVDTVYYCMLLITSLGFSDLVPTTLFGKALAVFYALFGISWMALFTAILIKRIIR